VIHYKIPGGVTQKTINRKERKMNTLVKIVGLLSAAAGLIIFFGLLFSLPVMLLWNAALVPAIPGLAEIGWLQAWGIVILSGFLFKPVASSKSN
jgi:Sec-independent protein secretion pathway component TatC